MDKRHSLSLKNPDLGGIFYLNRGTPETQKNISFSAESVNRDLNPSHLTVEAPPTNSGGTQASEAADDHRRRGSLDRPLDVVRQPED